MPRNEKVELVSDLRGVDLFRDATRIDDNQFRKLRNYYPARGSVRLLSKRLGSIKYNSSAVSGVTRFDNGIRAWKADNTKALLVAGNRAAADRIYAGNDSLGTFAEVTGTVLPAAAKYFFANVPLLGACYIASGDSGVPLQKTTDFLVRTDISTTPQTDAAFVQFLLSYHQRLVGARTLNNPYRIYQWDAGSDTGVLTNAFWSIEEPVTALAKTAFGTQETSLREMLIAAGSHSLYFVPGPDTTTAIEQASNSIGCKSPKTMKNTPIGLVFLGSDRQVYLIRSDPREPERIGTAILPELKNIPEAQLIDVCAVYQDGFYKLSFAAAGGSTNTIQYWADLDPVLVGEPRIDWYGPMDNLSILAFVLYDGPNDALTLVGLDDTAGTAWNLNQVGSYQDGSTVITSEFTTKRFDEKDPLRQKIWNGFDFGYLRGATGALAVTLDIDDGNQVLSDTITWTLANALWDSALWDTDVWGGVSFQEDVLNWVSRVVGKNISINGVHSAAADFPLRDFTRKARVIPRMQ